MRFAFSFFVSDRCAIIPINPDILIVIDLILIKLISKNSLSCYSERFTKIFLTSCLPMRLIGGRDLDL